jgi:hypothetical protein
MTRRLAFPCVAAFPLAALVAVASLGGIVLPATYASETASWAAQGVGQDWVNLAVAVPWLSLSGLFALRGSRRALLLLAGALAYLVYSFLIYALAVHFNSLFLVYCAVLGLSFFSLTSIGLELHDKNPSSWYREGVPVRLAGGLLITIGLLFASLWLREVLPALAQGTVPVTIVEAGLFTNPVHVLDLSICLPALLIAGVSILRRRGLGYVLAPVLLGFGVLMAIAIAGMILLLSRRGLPVGLAVPSFLGVLALACTAVLVSFLRHLQPSPPSPLSSGPKSAPCADHAVAN